MARALITPSNLSNIAGAIREKNGTSTTYKPGEMGDAIRALNMERNVVNAIIEQYKSQTGTISADTFVEFVNGAVIEKGTDTTFLNVSNAHNYASSAQIDTNKVFVAHRNGNYLNGVVCTISGTTITAGTAVALSDTNYSYYYPSVVKLATNKVFIAHRGSMLNGIICTISGTTITKGTDTVLITASNSYNDTKAVQIDTNKVFVARSNSNQFLSGIVCTINGTTITSGTDTILVNSVMSHNHLSAVKLATNKVFLAHRSDTTNSYLNGIICTISGTTITKGTDTTLVGTAGSSWYATAVLVDTNKIFIAHRSDGTNNYLNALICTISGTTITPGTDIALVETDNSSYDASAALIDSNNVFIAHRGGSYLNALICTISGTTITPGTDIVLSTASYSYNYISSVLVDTNKIFTSHRRSSYLGGVVCNIERKFITPSSTKIDGLTKAECTTSVAGDVWVFPNFPMEDFDCSYFNIVSAAIDTPDSGYELGIFPVDIEYIEYSSMVAASLLNYIENGDYGLRDITVADAFSDFEDTSYIEIYDSSGEYSTEEDISYFDNYYLVTKFAGLCEQRTNGSAQQYQTDDGMDCQMFFNCKNDLFIGNSGSKPTHLVLFTEYADTITLVEIDPNSIDSTTGQFTAYAPYFGIIGLVYKDE